MKMKRKNLKAALTLILAITILMLPFEIFASGASLGSTATPDEAGEAEPVSAGSVAEVNGTGYATLGEAVNAWTAGSTLKLLLDVTTDSTIIVPSGEHTLDLNGYGIRMTGSGSVINVGSGAVLNLNDSGSTVHYFDVDSSYGYAKNINTSGGAESFTGGYITGGYALNGGGININGGTLNMDGGSVIGNRAESNGNKGGGLNISDKGKVTLSGGSISYNYAQNAGGGVALRDGDFTMTGGEISHNSVSHAGGAGMAFHHTGTFTMTGGSIINNHAGWTGGGIDCYSANEGDARIIISGSPVIKDNSADNNGSSIDSVNNVMLRGNIRVTIDGKLTDEAAIGILLQNGTGVFTSGWKANMGGADPSKYFTSDNSSYQVFLNDNGEAEIGTPPAACIISGESTTNYNVLSDALNAWTAGSTLKLYSDVTMSSPITVPSGDHTLDLNGCGILMTGNDRVITINQGASLVLNDSDPDRIHYITLTNYRGTAVSDSGEESVSNGNGVIKVTGGYLTGGYRNNSGSHDRCGAGVYNWGTFVMNGGSIVGNTLYNNSGGAIRNSGYFTMNGGAIAFNYASGNGGGVTTYVPGGSQGKMTMNGGEISDNYCGSYGGGIQIAGPIEMTGGYVTRNTAGASGNGIYYDGKNDRFKLSGDPVIKDNSNNDDLYLGANATFMINGLLTEDADIHVLMNTPAEFTVGWKNIMGSADPSKYFKSGDSNYAVILNNNGEAEIGTPPAAGIVSGETITYYNVLSDAVNAWATGSTLKLLSDVTTSNTVTVPTGEHTLDLNGHGIKMIGTDSVITVDNGATLMIDDSDKLTEHRYTVSNPAANGAGLATVDDSLTSGYKTFNGGYITGGKGKNYSTWSNGGGIYIGAGSTVVLYSGTIIGNGRLTHTNGGALRTNGSGASFIMYGGEIRNNEGANGGAMRLYGGADAKIYGGRFTGNRTNDEGGAISAGDQATLLLKDCEISGNDSKNKGGGVWIWNTVVTFSGNTVISDNSVGAARDNLEIGTAGMDKAIFSDLGDDASIGVKLQSGIGAFTTTWKANMGSADPSKYFTSDNSSYQVFVNSNGEVEIGIPPVASIISGGTTTNYSSLSDAVNAWTAGSTLKLLSDVMTNSTVTVPSGEHHLDLNGYGITRTGATGADNSGIVITVNNGVDLTVTGPGKITGGKGFHGGGIHVEGNSALVLDNCEISGNTGHYGGGLYLSSGTITLKNGTVVKGNSASDGFGGSGIYAEGNATLILNDCTFTDNAIRNNNQYAVFLAGNANVKVSGAPVIYDNTYSGTQKNLYLYQASDQHSTVLVAGTLTDGAKIGVGQTTGTGVFTSGWKAIMGSASPSKYFTSDNDSYPVFLNESGEAEIGIPPVVPNVSATGFDGDYDGAAHSVTVSAPDGATVGFGTKEGSYTLTESPNYTNAGAYTVYYKVSKENYTSVYGSAQVIINKINVTVTITGHTITVDYDGNAHSADGYDVSSSSALYDVTKDYTYSGRAEAVRTDAGTTDMGLTASDFTNKNSNFNTVTFDVTDGYIKVEPINATVTITGHTNTVDYDGNAHSADGYDAQSSTDLYDVTKDFIYNGKAEAVRTYAGTTYMGLTAENFQNTNSNFATVTFNVTDGYQTVNKVDSVLTIAPRSNTGLVYNGSAQTLLTAGAATGGTLYYAFGSDDVTAPSGGYKAAVPTATDVGNYYVWYLVEGDGNHNSISPACIKVTIAEKEWITITGKVVDSNNNPVKDATVSLTLGGRTVDSILSGSDGGYYFTVPAGLYNIVVKTNESTVTDSVDISQTSVYDIAVPNADTDSLLDVVDSDKNIVVGGLNKEADTIRTQEGIAPDKNVTVKMTVTPVYSSSTDAAAAIEEFASDRYVECYDFKVEKTVDTQTTYLDSTQNVLEIAIPCSFTSKRELMVYLYDGSSVSTLTESDSKLSGTFRVDAATGMINLYANKISTYAIGYKPYYSVKSTFSLGDFTGIATVELSKDGETVVKLNDVPLDNVSFSGISKGIYSMTVTWIDGAENSLTLPFTIK